MSVPSPAMAEKTANTELTRPAAKLVRALRKSCKADVMVGDMVGLFSNVGHGKRFYILVWPYSLLFPTSSVRHNKPSQKLSTLTSY